MKKMQINDKNRLEPSVLLFGMYQKKRQCVCSNIHTYTLHVRWYQRIWAEHEYVFFNSRVYDHVCSSSSAPVVGYIVGCGVYIEEKQEKHAQLKRHTLERVSEKKSISQCKKVMLKYSCDDGTLVFFHFRVVLEFSVCHTALCVLLCVCVCATSNTQKKTKPAFKTQGPEKTLKPRNIHKRFASLSTLAPCYIFDLD